MNMSMQDEHLQFALETWKKTIDVQQHFNDLELRIRNYAVTILVAVFGAVGLIIGKSTSLSTFGFTTSSAIWLLVVGLIAWLAFYVMDRWWYHRLLQGAVHHAEAIEAELKDKVPGIALTTTISNASRFKLFGSWTVKASVRIDLFYGVVSLFLILSIIALWKH